MAAIPSNMNFINIQFKNGVKNEIDENLLIALRQIIRPNFPWKYIVTSLTISSLFDSHEEKPASRHNQKKAIDISSINGKSIITYGIDPEITNLVQYIQTEFEKVRGRRENFGPFKMLKLGSYFFVSGHENHIHLSIN